MLLRKEIISEDNIWNVQYLLDVPWAHPLWSQYALYGLSLDNKSFKKRPDVTHEVILFALNPDYKVVEGVPIKEQTFRWLEPANCAYQLATTNEGLTAILDAIVSKIERKTMSPDTDFRWQWDEMFIKNNNAVTLLSSIFDPPATKH